MKHGHWFLNRPSFCFPIDPDAGALIQRLRLEATVFQRPNPTQYGRHTPHLSKQKRHIMISAAIMANWFDLVQCAVDFYLLWSYRCVSQPRSASQLCVWARARACVCPYSNKWRFGTKSLELCSSFNWHLHAERIINFYFPYYLSIICVNVSRHQRQLAAPHPPLTRLPSSSRTLRSGIF